MHEEALAEFGLTTNERALYLALLTRGPSPPGSIAQHLDMHRSYAYDAMDRMEEKGVVRHVVKDGKKRYAAVSPERLAEMLELRLTRFKSAVPDLLSLSDGPDDPDVTVHTGTHVYRELLKDIMGSGCTEVLLIGVDETMLLEEVEPIYLRQYLNVIEERSVTERIIVPEGARTLERKHLAYRELPSGRIGETVQAVYGESVAIFVPGSPYTLILIDDPTTADSFRKRFEILWEIAE